MKILNLGSLNLDHVYRMEHFVMPGETTMARSYQRFFGGKGHNQSIALAKAGLEVWHAGLIGPDGEGLLEDMQAVGIHTDCTRTVAYPTGHTIIQVDQQGQNAIIYYPGANQKISRPWLDDVFSHFQAGDVLILQNEISELPYILIRAKECGMKIILNPSPIDDQLMTTPLSAVDLLTFNEIEGAALASTTEPEAILQALRRQYPHMILLFTLGERGALLDFPDGSRFEQAALPADVQDTTAAGDSFTGYFLAAFLQGKSPQDSLLQATVAASITISRPGAADAIPSLAEVHEKYAALARS